MRSLSQRLSLSLAASLALFFLLLAFIFGIESESLSEKTVLSRMEHDMESVLSATQLQGEQIQLDATKIDAIYERPLSGHYFQLHSGEGVIRSRSLWDQSLNSFDAGVHRDVAGPDGQHLLILSREFRIGKSPVTLTLAEDMSDLYHQAQEYQKRLLLLLFFTLLALLGLQVWVIRRAMRPLGQVRQALLKLEQGENSQLQLDLPSEINPLVQEVNRLLLVMQERLARSRSATGNLAHALKTPLAVIRRTLEGGPAINVISEQTGKIESLIERELSRARLAGTAPGGFWPEPEQDLRDMAAMLKKVHGEKVQIELEMESGLHLPADREDMLELIGNLLDNACKWSSRQVRCTLRMSRELELIVEDDGPGMAEGAWQELLQRGMRSDESRPGHGLGLAIVNDIVTTYGGRISAGRSEMLGGLRVELSLPLQSSQESTKQ
ncbi:Signal transduction histidine kinase [Mariprofundus ferrinatatus]|uniref:histidine kinase n=1 Tax=Mariprofundus ferrinatatus TaxID=1921087 RepID=A0A2K8L4H8_9PROT|nr:sensor histidine kinase [Mariprofundus ferrinatatus]ATX82187.1 Signal transduction histidine kinase [Mariprofundus ferrinatatus]